MKSCYWVFSYLCPFIKYSVAHWCTLYGKFVLELDNHGKLVLRLDQMIEIKKGVASKPNY